LGFELDVGLEGTRENHFFLDAASTPLRVVAADIVEVVEAALDMTFVEDLAEEVKGISNGLNTARR
jgi:hypothetical protein